MHRQLASPTLADYKSDLLLVVSTKPNSNGSSPGTEKPLVTAKPSGSGSENYRLLHVVHLDTQPPFVLTHVGDKVCEGDFFAVFRPHAMPCRMRSRPNAALADEVVEIELEPCFKADSSSRSRHGRGLKNFREWAGCSFSL
jgi:hypothetical protein